VSEPIQQFDIHHVTPRSALWLALRAPDSYGLVFILLITSFLFTPLHFGSGWLWVRVLLQGGTMLFALHTSRVSRRIMMGASVLVAVCVLLSLIPVFTGGGAAASGVVEAMLALLIAVAMPVILVRILTAGRPDLETVLGAIDVYIMLGLLFSSVFAAIGLLSGPGHPFFEGHSHVTLADYQFFSFVTMTTVGYGNLVPATSSGQSLAVLEALFGQVYLVTLVARLVSGLQPGAHRRAAERLLSEREEREQSDPGPARAPSREDDETATGESGDD
jgi:hypothetical protein